MARLGEILRLEKLLTASELDVALENHVLHGVKLGTCLVEMGFVSDDDLAQCLGKKLGQPFLTKDQLCAYGTQNLAMISQDAIMKRRLIPVGINGGALRIATDHELSPKKRAELEQYLGRNIEPVAVSGYAIDYFLEKVFGIPRPGRFLKKHSRTKTPKAVPTVAEKIAKETAPLVIDGTEWQSLADVTQSAEYTQMFEDIFTTTMALDEVPLSLTSAAEHLSRAKNRDDVAKTVLDFLSNSSRSAALFNVDDDLIRGWAAYSDRKKIPEFGEFSAPIEALPDLQHCVVTKKPYLGPSTTVVTMPLLPMLLSPGGRSAYFPIILQERVVAVLQCDRSEQLNSHEILELCRKASCALEILILRSRLLCT